MKENANTALYDKAIDRAAMTRLYDRHLEGQVTVILDGHEVRLDELIRKRHISMPQIDDEIRRTFRSVNRTTRASLLDLAKNEVSFAYQNLEAVASRLLPPKRVPHRVTAEFILERPLYSDRTLEMGWSGIAVHERKRLEKIIREGIAEGKTHEQIALEVRKGNVHRITRQQSRSLVTTAVTSVTAQSDQSVYRMNRHLLRGWQYVAVLDDRTTWTCAHRDGEIFDVDNVEMLPPAHYNCRSTTIPVLKSWDDLLKSETLTALQRRKIEELPPDLLKYYDGEAPDKESYHSWLARQPQSVQLRHLGDYEKVKLFQSGKIHLNKFTDDGREIGLNELKATSDSGYNIPGTTRRFAEAKERLDAMQLPILTPDDLINDKELRKTLREYFILQSTGLDGTLSLTNYRGLRIHTKSAMKRRILTSPPTEAQLIYNPITGRYMDARLYQPTPGVLNDAKRRVREATDLLDRDKEFILDFVDSLDEHLGMNERAVITENLRHIFRRQRENGEYWGNFKAVVQSQIKYDVVNISDAIETQLRYDSDVYKKLLQGSFIDPVLGNTMLRKLHDEFVPSIIARNKWEDSVAPKIARQLRDFYDADLLLKHPVLWNNISERELDKFYMKFVHRLASADMPDRDQLAVSLGRDLYNAAGLNGTKKKWFELGLSLLEKNNDLFEIETFGVQKRRMRGKITGAYFGPYYDTLTYNLRLMDPRLQEYLKLTRKVETGMRVPSISDSNILLVRPNYKTYFVRHRGGWYDTRIPITSDFKDFPAEFVDREMADALNWAARARYRINDDFHEAMRKLLYFEDDRGKAKHYNERNEFRKYLAARGDTYERFKTMEWLSQEKLAFSNNVFIDHRARIYERGFIGPQAGETFRPFLDSAKVKALGVTGFDNFVDQMGAFLGGLSDKFEGRFDSLTFEGRRKIANKWRPEMVKIGNHLRRGKPADIRAVLDSEIVALVDGEELAKFYRFAMESAKIDEYLRAGTEKPLAPSDVVSKEMVDERKDVAGLLRLLDINNVADPEYTSNPREILLAQQKIIRMAASGKINRKELQEILKWLHTADIKPDPLRMERATYKTFDHKTGRKFSKEELEQSRLKFEQRSSGNTEKYLTMQIVEELGELLEAHLRAQGISERDAVYGLIEAQKRALKVSRFGADTIIKDVDSPYYLKTNRQAANAAAREVGLKSDSDETIESLIFRLNERILKRQSSLALITNPYSKANLQRLDKYMTSLVMEQDASSSGAQIIALTTRNKQLAELSNVVPTFRKQRLYDEIAALTFEDPRFREINVRLGLTEKDLRKAAKGKVMVQFYGAGERTGILSIEGKLAKLLEKDSETLVIKASQRDAIISEISARIARVERYDPDGAMELRDLRDTVKEVLNKGQNIGEQMMEDLWFLDSKTRDFLEKASSSYNRVVTPNDFKVIGKIMSEYMEEEVPILKNFTRHLGKMAEAYLLHAKPSQSDFDWVEIAKGMIHKGSKGYVLPNRVSEILGLRANEPVREKILKRFLFWQPGSNLRDFVFGVPGPHPTKSGVRADSTPYNRRTGAKYFKLDIPYLTLGVTRKGLRPKLTVAKEKSFGVKLFRANKMPKSWTRIPWVNFDGKTLEQSFTQSFEERLTYKDVDGNWITNIIQVPQKSQNSWWDEILNKKGKISDIADVTKAKTAYGVNANHSNDAVIVKRFHLWGRKNNIMTSTVHDAFFTHISDMFDARAVLRKIYADTLRSSPIKATLDEMRKRGLPRDVYEQLLNEAIELGLIPVIGRSRIGGRLMTDTDILLREDVLREIPKSFDTKFGWYGVG